MASSKYACWSTAFLPTRLRIDGTLAVTVEPAACNAEGQCLELRFHPDPSASTEAQAAMGFLFGCDDAEGKIQCEGRRALRTFYRYPKDQAE